MKKIYLLLFQWVRIGLLTVSLQTPERTGTFSQSSFTVSLGLVRSLLLMAAIILLVSFFPCPVSDLLFLWAGFEGSQSQSPEATQLLWVDGGTSVRSLTSLELTFPPFFSKSTDFRVPGDACLFACHVMLTMVEKLGIVALYRHQLLRLRLRLHPPPTGH